MKQRLPILFLLLSLLTALFAGCRSQGENGDIAAIDTEAVSEVGTTDAVVTEAPETESPRYFPPYEDGEVVLRFILASDTHVTSANRFNMSSRRTRQMINLSYDYAATQPYKGLDAVVVAGDLTDFGRVKDYESFKKIMDEEIREGTQLITVMGNHGYHEGVMSNYTDILNPDLHAHAVIKGYHFIGISCIDGYGAYGAMDIKHMRDGVEEALAADPEKPVITFQHHPVSAQLSGIYAQSSRIVNFHGHTHSSVNHPNAINQGAFTSFNNGTITYTYLGGGETPINVYNEDDAGQFCLVEITADHRVRILPFNLLSEDFFHIPATDKQLVYEFDVNHPETWAYTAAARANSGAPAFPEGSAIRVNLSKEGKPVSVTFPQAVDDELIYRYQFLLEGDKGTYRRVDYSSGYTLDPIPMELSIPLSDYIILGESYEVTLYPYDAFGNRGEPLSVTFDN